MSEGNVRRVWSEEELDLALETLYTDEAVDSARLRLARPRPIRRRRRPWILSAAAIAVLVAGLGLVALVTPPRPDVGVSVKTELGRIADRVHPDPPLGPGQYRYVALESWYQKGWPPPGDEIRWLAELRRESWLPADPAAECLVRRVATGTYRWLAGADRAAEVGPYLPVARTDDDRRPCYGTGEVATWQLPTPAWLAGLPRDPDWLHDVLYQASGERVVGLGDPDRSWGMLVYACDVLRDGQVPADLRAALYRVLADLPGLAVTDRAANLDTRVGVAFGMTRPGERLELVVDPDTGGLLGVRETHDGVLFSSTSVTTAVVNGIGVRPVIEARGVSTTTR